MLTVKQRVQNGVDFLDENIPDWLDRVNLDELDMDSDTKCIFSQAAGMSYYRASEKYNLVQDEDCGFCTKSNSDARRLTQEWSRVIPELRNNPSRSTVKLNFTPTAPKSVKFSELEVHSVFEYEGNPYIKAGYKEGENSFCLSDSTFVWFGDDDMVIPRRATIKVV